MLPSVKQSYGNQYWSLPGGLVEYGKSVDQAAIRKVKEEIDLDIRVKRMVGMKNMLTHLNEEQLWKR